MPLSILVGKQERAHVTLYGVVSDMVSLQLFLEQLLLAWSELVQMILLLLLLEGVSLRPLKLDIALVVGGDAVRADPHLGHPGLFIR